MPSFWNFWRRHKRKIFFTAGVAGTGFVLYRLYDARRRRRMEADEYAKRKLQDHFEIIQKVSDSVTLPSAIHCLSSRISGELDLSHLRERLMRGKGESTALTLEEKLELWQKIKILSFTRAALALWSCTVLTLYARVQINILGRHLYLDIARECASSRVLDDTPNKQAQQEFLRTVEYLPNYSIRSLIPIMQSAASTILRDKQLSDHFSVAQLRETIVQILDKCMRMMQPRFFVSCLLPENATAYKELAVASCIESDNLYQHVNLSTLEQLMAETHAVLSSPEFESVLNISLQKVIEAVMDDTMLPYGDTSSGAPLVKLLALVVQKSVLVLEEPSQNRLIHTIQTLPEIEQFCTIIYANMPVCRKVP